MIQALDHINITTTNDKLEETRRFFIEILGLTEGYRPPFGIPGHWLYVGRRDVVHLIGLDKPVDTPKGALDHFAFQIADYDTMKARLDARGIRYSELAAPDGSRKQFFLRDPNGVSIELSYHAREMA